MNDQPRTELVTVETPLDRRRVGDMKIEKFSGLTFSEYREAVEFSKVMCQARNSIPKYLKQNVGDCLAIVTQSLRWNLEPFWVAQHSYIARDHQDSLIAYDAAVHAAIVLSRGNLKGKPRYSYDGEGEQRTCTVIAQFVGEDEPHEYTTPPLARCRPPKNQDGVVKGSPLWSKDPDQQLGYYAIRNWGRRHCPEVLGGVYDKEEFTESSQDDDVVPVSPNLLNRLSGRMTEGHGFHPDNVANGIAGHDTTGDDAAPATKGTASSGAAASPKNTAGQAAEASGSSAADPDAADEGASEDVADQQQSDGEGAKPVKQAAHAPGPEKATEPADGAKNQPAGSAGAKKATPKKAAPANDDKPAPEADPDVFPEPHIKRTSAEYVAYVDGWLSRAASSADIDKRWGDERKIRNALGIPVDEDQLEHMNKAKGAAKARCKGST